MTYGLRGFKGLWWEPEQYRDWPRLLAEAGYTFFMLCYTFAPELGLRWRQPFRRADETIIRCLASDCAARGIELCLAVNPNIGGHAWTPDSATLPFHPTAGRDWFRRYWQARRPNEALDPDPPFRYGNAGDLALLADKLRRAADWGVRAFALSLDDIDPSALSPEFPSLAAAQVWLVEGVHAALGSGAEGAATRDGPEGTPRLFFTPTYYWTVGLRAHSEYAAELAASLPPDVQVFWTGEHVRTPGPDLTRASARDAARLLGRKPILWFNYASNDSFRFAPQLPPGPPPGEDLGDEVGGVLVNPMRQASLTRLHALVMGAYLRDPAGYDHEVAVEGAARRLVGEDAAPWLLRCIAAWAAYPDTRTLGADLEREGAPLASALLARLEPAYGQLLAALASVERLDADYPLDRDGRLGAELRHGADRFRLLVAALRARVREDPSRGGVDAMLAESDEETASDARVVLDATIR
ncbi:MAG: protein O-GlcNAcase [Chloroflexota bacterium]|nr:protein O-GlcNAcase [Chloroflexota bacterium]